VDCFCFKHLLEFKKECDDKLAKANPLSTSQGMTERFALPPGYTGGLKDRFIWYATLQALSSLFTVGHEREDFTDWSDIPAAVRGTEGFCSWCFSSCNHSLSMIRMGIFKPLFKCNSCSNQTQKCDSSGCDNFSRPNESECAFHASASLGDTQEGWWESEESAAAKSEQVLERFCSWCFTKGMHSPIGFSPSDDRVQYVCDNCELKTVSCRALSGCKFAMACGGMFMGNRYCGYHEQFSPSEPQYLYYERHQNRVEAVTQQLQPKPGRSLLQELNNDRDSYCLPPNLKSLDMEFLAANGTLLRERYQPVAQRVSKRNEAAEPEGGASDTPPTADEKDSALDEVLAAGNEATAEATKAATNKMAEIGTKLAFWKSGKKGGGTSSTAKDEEDEDGEDDEDAEAGGSGLADGDLDDDDGGEEEEDAMEFPSWEQNESLRKKVWAKGLVRPFMSLLSMTHKQRLRVAGMTGVKLAEQSYFGTSRCIADRIHVLYKCWNDCHQSVGVVFIRR
jgi:hypothetical protein